MLALGIDTATWMGSISLVDDLQGVLIEENIKSRASHSERLLPRIERILKEADKKIGDCACVCICIGPGSFTGLRIGMATAKGLAYAAQKPLIGISTLEILARALPYCCIPVCPVIDARKREVYTCFYEWRKYELKPMGPEMALRPETLIKKIAQPTLFMGDGIITYGDFFKKELGSIALFAPHTFNYPRASILAEQGLKKFSLNQMTTPEAIIPVYIRPSEAEINWEAKNFKKNTP